MIGEGIRVATWNVRGFRAGVDTVADAIRAHGPDVLLVQESGLRRRLHALGAALGMAVAADPLSFPRRRIENAVLVRPPLRIGSHRLVRFAGGSVLYPRGAQIADLGGFSAISIHLGLRGPERGRHIRQLLTLLEGSSGRFVLGGDMNALPSDPGPSAIRTRAMDCWKAVGEGDGATFPAHAPIARIDHLFAGPAVQPRRAWTVGGTVSDHLMVVADLELTGGRGSPR